MSGSSLSAIFARPIIAPPNIFPNVGAAPASSVDMNEMRRENEVDMRVTVVTMVSPRLGMLADISAIVCLTVWPNDLNIFWAPSNTFENNERIEPTSPNLMFENSPSNAFWTPCPKSSVLLISEMNCEMESRIPPKLIDREARYAPIAVSPDNTSPIGVSRKANAAASPPKPVTTVPITLTNPPSSSRAGPSAAASATKINIVF